MLNCLPDFILLKLVNAAESLIKAVGHWTFRTVSSIPQLPRVVGHGLSQAVLHIPKVFRTLDRFIEHDGPEVIGTVMTSCRLTLVPRTTIGLLMKRGIVAMTLLLASVTIQNLWTYEYIPYIPRSHRHRYLSLPRRLFTATSDVTKEAIDTYRYARTRHRLYGTETDLFSLAVICLQSEVPMPNREHDALFDMDSAEIGIDNRCSGCISHVATDFVGQLHKSDKSIRGFGGTKTLKVMTGTLKWKWTDDNGKEHKFLIPNSYYVPHGGVRLLSPQHWAQTRVSHVERHATGERTGPKDCTLYWKTGKVHYSKTVPLDTKGANLATMHLAPGYSTFSAFCAEMGVGDDARGDILYEADPVTHSQQEVDALSDDEEDVVEISEELDAPTTEDSEPNTWKTEKTPTQRDFDLEGPHTKDLQAKAPVVVTDEEDQPGLLTDTAELLQHHYRFSHISFRKLQLMAQAGIIPKRLAKCNVPVCSACMYAKATKRPWRSKTRKNSPKSCEPLRPGSVVSVDQMVSPVHGLIAQMTGFLTNKRYRYATVFVDQATRLGYVYLQKTSTAEETIKAKQAFEAYSRVRGVQIKAYHADNGIFKANAWVEACEKAGQPLTFAGVNAHHQNGLAERRIRELQELTRTSLVHANRRWPKAVTANLWPYALRMANTVYNASPSLQNPERHSPEQLFSGTTAININPKHWKPFGCPVYVLDNDLQQGKPHGKWEERSRIGLYLGQSPFHNQSVALVLNLSTGYASPQFHVQFDPSFHTISQEPNLEIKWLDATGFRNPKSAKRKKKDRDPSMVMTEKKRKKANTNETNNVSEGDLGSTIPEGAQSPSEHVSDTQQAGTERPQSDGTQRGIAAQQEGQSLGPNQLDRATTAPDVPQDSPRANPEGVTDTPTGIRRSSRVSRPPERLIHTMTTEILKLTQEDIPGELFCYEVMYPEGTACHDTENPLLVYKASTDPDTMYMHEAMREPDHKEFIKAMEKEVEDQMNNGNFTIVHKSEVPKGCTILQAVWQMKRKRDIVTRQIKKYKARLNVDGSKMQQGVHYDQTYAPVASWMSVKLLLALTVLHDWHTTQIDYVLAFPQAPVEKELYMRCPKGFRFGNVEDTRDYVLRLNRNVYGQKQAGRVWNKYLVNKLVNEVGFVQSEVDECIFYKGNVIYVLYTDDSILAGPDKREIEEVIELIKKAKLDITVEGDIKDFLGVNIVRKRDKVIFSQPQLIDKILTALGLNDEKVKPTDTPARSSVLISRHSDSPEFDNSFNYRSVIGMLGYLETTRSDISYASHQCARFSANPKIEHGKAVRHIGRYLKGTRDMGTIFKPDATRGLEVFVDADFMGNWDPKEAATDRDTARSRHGYIITYAGCPIVTKSQLQTEICLSTTESEYTGLSYALREAIPIIRLLDEMKGMGFPVTSTEAKIKCEVFEDNSGALEIAKNPKYRPRTKHLNGRLHHFRSWVESKRITIHKIDTTEQCADYLTKAVPVDILTYLRKKVMGW